MENNWTIEQTKTLFELAGQAKSNGVGLVWAFSRMSEQSGRSLNSVRNYYYSQLKMFELVPALADDLGIKLVSPVRERFELFAEEEITELLKRVLTGKAKGISVRKTISDMSGGDGKKALRLQNKYRSMVIHHRDKVNEVMRLIASGGEDYYNPYVKEVVAAGSENDNYKRLNDYISSLDEEEVGEFLRVMKKFFA